MKIENWSWGGGHMEKEHEPLKEMKKEKKKEKEKEEEKW